MSKKFHCPNKLKKIPNSKPIIEWYEDKLIKMERRQNKLSLMLSNIYKKLKNHET